MTKKPATVWLSLRMPEEIVSQLKYVSAMREQSVSAIIRSIIYDKSRGYVDREPYQAPEKTPVMLKLSEDLRSAVQHAAAVEGVSVNELVTKWVQGELERG